ncbi:MAG: UDP-2,3-diacylglucosamine diphosphatase [Candidatus Nitrosotenuis sp.]
MRRVKTCWISDLHLGSTQCQADKLREFLKIIQPEKLYLVGDIIDFWALSRKSYWPTDHNTVLQKILRMARHGVEVIYIPGNHDSPVRDLAGMSFGNVQVKLDDIHEMIDGRKFLVTHGDQFDTISNHYGWLSKFGAIGYDFLLQLNRLMRFFQKLLGIKSHFSLSSFIKYKVKNVVKFISDYEHEIIDIVKSLNLDGIICGHIHHAELISHYNFLYLNTGDWVESLTAIVETHNGDLILLQYSENMLNEIKKISI